MSTAITRRLNRNIAELLRDEAGQGLVEYALILMFVALVAVVVITVLGPDIAQYLNSIGTSL